MAIPNLALLLILSFAPLVIGLSLIGYSLYKKKRVPLYSLGVLLVGLLFMTLGNVTTYSSGASLDKSPNITQYSTYKGESYSTPIRALGKVTISKVKAKDGESTNRRVKIVRNMFTGTKITVTENDLLLIKK